MAESSASAPLRGPPAQCILVVALALVLRLGHAWNQGLWGDELFSLALATGHSLEGAPATWVAGEGDFVLYEIPTRASELRIYLEHVVPVASPSRVARAVQISDTNPPLYYLLLWAWTLVGGTSDYYLRLFSIIWSAACLPLLWLLGEKIGGQRVAFVGCLLFAILPLSLDYSIEVRMYSMVWFWALCAAYAALMLHKKGPSLRLGLAWILASAAGMLTHYFFTFAWVAIVIWLLSVPGRSPQRQVLLYVAATLALVAPWYIHLPDSLSAWRLTKDWLKLPSVAPQGEYRTLALFVRNAFTPFLSENAAQSLTFGDLGRLSLIGALLLWAGTWAITGARLLVVLWWLVPVFALFLVDFVQGTYSAAKARYTLAAMPAAMLLVGIGCRGVSHRVYVAIVSLLIVVSLPRIHQLLTSDARNGWYVAAGEFLDQNATPNDLVLVHSIPSGILGLTRYAEKPFDVALWTQQLRRHLQRDNVSSIAADTVKLACNRGKIFVVIVHEVGEAAPELGFLLEHADLISDVTRGASRIIELRPRDDGRFFVGQTLTSCPTKCCEAE